MSIIQGPPDKTEGIEQKYKNCIHGPVSEAICSAFSKERIACALGTSNSFFWKCRTYCVTYPYISAKSISTYPMDTTGTKRIGSPICDQYYMAQFTNGAALAFADGCGWGEESRCAARCATDTFVNYVMNQANVCSSEELVLLMLRALQRCHDKILAGRSKDEYFSVGTTTMIGGALMKVKL